MSLQRWWWYIVIYYTLCRSVATFLGVYGSLGVGQVLFILIGSFMLTIGGILGSISVHNNMLANILCAPMSFFDITPIGRLLNRFSKDIYIIDETIPKSLRCVCQCRWSRNIVFDPCRMFVESFFSVASTLIVICIATPFFIIVTIPLGVFYFFVQVHWLISWEMDLL